MEELLKSKYLLIEIECSIPILVNLTTFKVENWPTCSENGVCIEEKVCDSGIYTLLDENMKIISKYQGYVPKMIPNDWGDYLNLNIDASGQTNIKEIIFDEWLKLSMN